MKISSNGKRKMKSINRKDAPFDSAQGALRNSASRKGTRLGNSKYSRHSRTLKALLDELTQRFAEKTQSYTELAE
jgi:hypothetical protein